MRGFPEFECIVLICCCIGSRSKKIVQYLEFLRRFKEVKTLVQILGYREYQFTFVKQRLDKNTCYGLEKVGVYDCFGKKLHLILTLFSKLKAID
jgi:hypothetical protein